MSVIFTTTIHFQYLLHFLIFIIQICALYFVFSHLHLLLAISCNVHEDAGSIGRKNKQSLQQITIQANNKQVIFYLRCFLLIGFKQMRTVAQKNVKIQSSFIKEIKIKIIESRNIYIFPNKPYIFSDLSTEYQCNQQGIYQNYFQMTNILSKTPQNYRITRIKGRNSRMPSNIGHFVLGQVLGAGGFGSVSKVLDFHTKEQAAVKIINIQSRSEYLIKKIQEQVNILQIVDHPNIVRIYETIQNESNYMIFMELINGKDLFEYICQNGRLTEKVAAHFFHQIVSAVKYLHQRGITHRDIKAQNIMIDSKFNAKLIDFGLATISNKKDDDQAQYCGSPSYMAPQLLDRKKYEGEKIDIWCLGVLLYIMLEANLPFQTNNQTRQERNKNIKNMEWGYPIFSSPQGKQLYAGIFVESQLRMSIDEIFNSKFFKKYHLNNLHIVQNEIGRRRQERAINLTSQILKIDRPRLQLQLKNRQLGQAYTVYNLLLKKSNIQQYSLQNDWIQTGPNNKNGDSSSESEELIQNLQKLKANINILKIGQKFQAQNQKKKLYEQKNLAINSFCKTLQAKEKKYTKIRQIGSSEKQVSKNNGTKQFFITKNLKNRKMTKSQILEQLKVGRKKDVVIKSNQYSRKNNYPSSGRTLRLANQFDH